MPRVVPRRVALVGASVALGLRHALGHALGAPRRPHCGYTWRPRRGPPEGPFPCRLRATRQVECGIWLLVGGGTPRDLDATRRLL